MGIFSLYLGFRKKTGPMYMGHYHICFYSKANAPYFPRVGVSIDRCIRAGFVKPVIAQYYTKKIRYN